MNPKTPFRIRLIQLATLVTLTFVSLTWWQFLSSSRPDTVPPNLIVRWDSNFKGFELLADKKFQIARGTRLLPGDEVASGSGCHEARITLPWHPSPWGGSWSHTIQDADIERRARVIDGREYQIKPVSIDGQEYREELFVDTLGNHHGYGYCLEAKNLWGYSQTVISEPIRSPVRPVDSHLTDTELIVRLFLSPELEIEDLDSWLKGSHLSYEKPRHPSSYEHPESCLPASELYGNIDFEYEEVPLGLVGRSFSPQPEGGQLELSIPLRLVEPQSSCYYVSFHIERVDVYFIHDSRLPSPQIPPI